MRDFPSRKERDGPGRRCPIASGVSTNYVAVTAEVEADIVQLCGSDTTVLLME